MEIIKPGQYVEATYDLYVGENNEQELMEKATDVATISITGLLPNGLIPVDTEFCIFVTSLVSLVTSDDTLKWSILENE